MAQTPGAPIPSATTEPMLPPDLHPEDPDDEWRADPQGRGVRVRALTGALVLLVVLAGGFWGGVVAEKHHGSGSSATAALASRFAALRTGTGTGAAGRAGAGAGAAGFSGFGGTGSGGTGAAGRTGGSGQAGAATTGTVVGVQGDVLDVSDANGNLVKVTVGPSVPVTRAATTPLSSLRVGDTVVVAGSTATDGTVTATSVRATAQAGG